VKLSPQSVLALAMVLCIVAIVYSPLVDLPLTDAKTNHSPVAPVHALPPSSATITQGVQVWAESGPHPAIACATNVVTITCAYLC